jgi:hypothetical protein
VERLSLVRWADEKTLRLLTSPRPSGLILTHILQIASMKGPQWLDAILSISQTRQ